MLWEKIKTVTKNMNTLQLMMLPIICSLLPLVLFMLIAPHGRYSGTIVEKILAELIIFLWGLSGIPIIIRKELPVMTRKKFSSLITIRGRYAVVSGIFIIILSWMVILGMSIGSK
jgi:hypothetical protein